MLLMFCAHAGCHKLIAFVGSCYIAIFSQIYITVASRFKDSNDSARRHKFCVSTPYEYSNR
jgi:hypothetical protein